MKVGRSLIVVLLWLGCAARSTDKPTTARPTAAPRAEPVATRATRPPARGQPAVQQLVYPDEAFRRQRPPAGALRPFRSPAIARFRLANGIDVYLVEQHRLPTLSVTVVFERGSASDPRGAEGLAQVCGALIGESTKSLDQRNFSERLADLAAEVASWATVDQTSVALWSLSEQATAALALWSEAVIEPGLRRVDFERLVDEGVVRLREQKGSASALSRRLLRGLVFGREHPRGRLATMASLRALTLAGCGAYHRAMLETRGAKVFVVGAIDARRLRLALAPLARLRPKRRAVALRASPRPPKARFFFVRVPDAKQSVIALAHPGPGRAARDYFANELMADILGGAFSSRINMNIREKHGYAYGAWGGFSYTRRGGYFVSAASVRNDVVGPALREIFGEIVKMRRHPVSEAERRREIEGAVLRLPAFFAGARATLRSYRELVYYGLPLDYYDRYVKGYRAVSREQIDGAARRHLRPGDLRVLVVGDPRHFVDALAQLGREMGSPVVELDSDGRPLSGAGKGR